MKKSLLSEPIEFWNERHAQTDAWRSGGDRGISVAENFELYAIRLGRLLELIRQHHSAQRNQRILDAGCGRGHLTNSLRQCGHRAEGIDSSGFAIEWAVREYGDHFVCSSLTSASMDTLYDVVVCIDVLFHILDDAEWEASLRALARLASTESTLIITDVLAAERFQLGDYIVHRAAADYDKVLGSLGYKLAQRSPYQFGANPNSFAVYRRSV